MGGKGILLLFVCILIASYLNMGLLVILLALVLFLFAIASIKREEPRKIPVPKGERDVIYPVIYEDVGEPPLLYPEFQKINIRPEWEKKSGKPWELTVKGIGSIFKIGTGLVTGKRKPKEEEEK